MQSTKAAWRSVKFFRTLITVMSQDSCVLAE